MRPPHFDCEARSVEGCSARARSLEMRRRWSTSLINVVFLLLMLVCLCTHHASAQSKEADLLLQVEVLPFAESPSTFLQHTPALTNDAPPAPAPTVAAATPEESGAAVSATPPVVDARLCIFDENTVTSPSAVQLRFSDFLEYYLAAEPETRRAFLHALEAGYNGVSEGQSLALVQQQLMKETRFHQFFHRSDLWLSVVFRVVSTVQSGLKGKVQLLPEEVKAGRLALSRVKEIFKHLLLSTDNWRLRERDRPRLSILLVSFKQLVTLWMQHRQALLHGGLDSHNLSGEVKKGIDAKIRLAMAAAPSVKLMPERVLYRDEEEAEISRLQAQETTADLLASNSNVSDFLSLIDKGNWPDRYIRQHLAPQAWLSSREKEFIRAFVRRQLDRGKDLCRRYRFNDENDLAHFAAQHNDPELLELIRTHPRRTCPINPEHEYTGDRALAMAVQHQAVEVASYILKHDPAANVRDTALVERNAVDEEVPLLWIAAYHRDVRMFWLLWWHLLNGTTVALSHRAALVRGDVNVFHYVVRGWSEDDSAQKRQTDFLHQTLLSKRFEELSLSRSLPSTRALINLPADSTSSSPAPLSDACRRGKSSLVRLLLETESADSLVNVRAITSERKNALHFALKSIDMSQDKRNDLIRFLILKEPALLSQRDSDDKLVEETVPTADPAYGMLQSSRPSAQLRGFGINSLVFSGGHPFVVFELRHCSPSRPDN